VALTCNPTTVNNKQYRPPTLSDRTASDVMFLSKKKNIYIYIYTRAYRILLCVGAV
jgi:hypothetical protein